MSNPNVFFDDVDPEMQKAYTAARAAFKFFWREQYWERRRIIPALDLSIVKFPFTDGPRTDGYAEYEHMWLSEIEFDGATVSGTLMNSPEYLSSVKEGDTVHMPVAQLSDWLISADGQAYGGFTINLIRSRMDRSDRNEHDGAWGLDFGDPLQVRVELNQEQKPKGGLLAGLFGAKPEPVKTVAGFRDCPMCTNMLPTIEAHLKADAAIARNVDEAGLTMLHKEALAGNMGVVALLIKYGADVSARTPSGQSAEALARTVGWIEIADFLKEKALTA